MRKTLIIVNGKARAGKDTIVQATSEYLNYFYKDRFITDTVSSIQPVIDILDYLDIDVSQKTDTDRKLMSDLGNVLEDYNGYRTNKTLQSFNPYSSFLFTFTREVRVIERMRRVMRDLYDGDTITLFVENPRVAGVSSNFSDANIDSDYAYDYRIVNDGSLQDLTTKCHEFGDYLIQLKNEM